MISSDDDFDGGLEEPQSLFEIGLVFQIILRNNEKIIHLWTYSLKLAPLCTNRRTKPQMIDVNQTIKMKHFSSFFILLILKGNLNQSLF